MAFLAVPNRRSMFRFASPLASFQAPQHSCRYFTASDSTVVEDLSKPVQAHAFSDNSQGRIDDKNISIRLSKLISQHTQNLAISRREAERLIRGGDVTVAGTTITSPHFLVDWKDLSSPGIVQVLGKPVAFLSEQQAQQQQKQEVANAATKVWIVHKLKGEVVAEHDPQGRPSMLERLMQGGVGKQGKKQRHHLKPIGRLDIPTEGLILVTNDGKYAREMELPSNELHRTYRVRVHGPLSHYKIKAMQRGISIADPKDGKLTRYAPMKVLVEGRPSKGTNTWIQITCTEGKNRQIRNVLKHLGLTVTRLIRTSFGDYQLQTIPPGMALEVPVKDVSKQKHKGPLFSKQKKQQSKQREEEEVEAPPVQWVRHYR